MGLSLSHKSLLKKMPYRLAYNPILWRHLLNWDAFLSDDFRVYQADIELPSRVLWWTGGIHLWHIWIWTLLLDCRWVLPASVLQLFCSSHIFLHGVCVCLYIHIHSSFIYNSQKLETTQMPLTKEWTPKMCFIYTVDYYSASKTRISWILQANGLELQNILKFQLSFLLTFFLFSIFAFISLFLLALAWFVLLLLFTKNK
jgi:hypothetical protein